MGTDSPDAESLQRVLLHPIDEMGQNYLNSFIEKDSRIEYWVNHILDEAEEDFYLRSLADNLLVTTDSHPYPQSVTLVNDVTDADADISGARRSFRCGRGCHPLGERG